jgi:hypothetical protein
MNISLIYPCFLYLLVTIYLYINNKTDDKSILSIMIFGQLLLLLGSSIKNDILIEIAHILYTVTIIYGVIYFQETPNKLFLLIIIFITLATRRYFQDCLFYKANSNTRLIDIDINFDYIYLPLFIIVIYKLLKI